MAIISEVIIGIIEVDTTEAEAQEVEPQEVEVRLREIEELPQIEGQEQIIPQGVEVLEVVIQQECINKKRFSLNFLGLFLAYLLLL